MGKTTEKTKIPVQVEFTDGYQQRFTEAILKIYTRRISEQERQSSEQGREICKQEGEQSRAAVV